MPYIDGSVGADVPLHRIAELFNVNTFLVSQVNPYVIPFISEDTGMIMSRKHKKLFIKTVKALQGNTVKFVLK